MRVGGNWGGIGGGCCGLDGRGGGGGGCIMYILHVCVVMSEWLGMPWSADTTDERTALGWYLRGYCIDVEERGCVRASGSELLGCIKYFYSYVCSSCIETVNFLALQSS